MLSKFQKISAYWQTHKRALSLCCLFVFGGLFLAATPVAATVESVAMGIFSNLFVWIINLMGSIIIWAIDSFIWIAQYNGFLEAGVVRTGWVVVRDMGNMFFVVFFIIMAFSTVWGIEKYHWKKMLSNMLIMAVLMNFSKGIAGVLIDFFQVIMLTFVSAFKDAAAVNFTNGLGITQMLNMNAATTNIDSGAVFISVILGVILSMIAAIVMIQILIVCVVRIIYLWVLVVLSPFAYVLDAFPDTAKYASQWWTEFWKYLTIGPVLAFFLWLSLSVMSTNIYSEMDGATGGATKPTANIGVSQAGSYQQMITFVVSIAMLMFAVNFAQKSGVAGGSWGAGMVTKLKDTGLSPVTKAWKHYQKLRDEHPGAIEKAAQWAGTKMYQGEGIAKGLPVAGFKGLKKGVTTGLDKGLRGMNKKYDAAIQREGEMTYWQYLRGGKEMPFKKSQQDKTEADWKLDGQKDKMDFELMNEQGRTASMQTKQAKFIETKNAYNESQLSKDENKKKAGKEAFDRYLKEQEFRYGKNAVDKDYGFLAKDKIGGIPSKVQDYQQTKQDFENFRATYDNSPANIKGQMKPELDKRVLEMDQKKKEIEDMGIQADDGKLVTTGSKLDHYNTDSLTPKIGEKMVYEAERGFKQYGGWEMAQGDIRQNKEVAEEAGFMEKQNLSRAELKKIFMSASSSSTEKLAAALRLAVKKGFDSPQQVTAAKTLMMSNKVMLKTFEDTMDKGQMHLNYDWKDPGDVAKFRRRYDKGELKISDASPDAVQSADFIKNIKNVVSGTGNFKGEMHAMAKRSKTAKEGLKSTLGSMAKENGIWKKDKDGNDTNDIDLFTSTYVSISGNAHEAFLNKKTGEWDNRSDEALKKFVQTCRNDEIKELQYQRSDLKQFDALCKSKEKADEAKDKYLNSLGGKLTAAHMTQLYRSSEEDEAAGKSDLIIKAAKAGDLHAQKEVVLMSESNFIYDYVDEKDEVLQRELKKWKQELKDKNPDKNKPREESQT